MKKLLNFKILGGVLAVLLLSAGFVQAQTFNFNTGCTTAATCSIPGGTAFPNSFESDANGKFFFGEQIMINGTPYMHMVIRDKADDTGGVFALEQFSKGGGTNNTGFFAQNTGSSIGQITFKEEIHSGNFNQVSAMDNLNIINRSANNITGWLLNVSQSNIDLLHGMANDYIPLIPDPNQLPTTDYGVNTTFNVPFDQTLSYTSGMFSGFYSHNADTGALIILPDQKF